MPWYLHLFWGLVVYRSALEVGRGVATCGEWIAKAMLKTSESAIALQREARPASKGRT